MGNNEKVDKCAKIIEPKGMVNIDLSKRDSADEDKVLKDIGILPKIQRYKLRFIYLILTVTLLASVMAFIIFIFDQTNDRQFILTPEKNTDIFYNCVKNRTIIDCCQLTNSSINFKLCLIYEIANLILLNTGKRERFKRQSDYPYENYEYFNEENFEIPDYYSNYEQNPENYYPNPVVEPHNTLPSPPLPVQQFHDHFLQNSYHNKEGNYQLRQNNEHKDDHLVTEFQTESPTTRKPIVDCFSKDCSAKGKFKTKIENISKVNGKGKTVEIDLNNTNIKIAASYQNPRKSIEPTLGQSNKELNNTPDENIKKSTPEEISRDNQHTDFDGKSKSDPLLNPCTNSPFYLPQSAYGAYRGFDNSQLLSYPQMYMVNPPMYPYIPQYPQIPFSPNYAQYQNAYRKNPVQVAGPSGQFYLCNPISQLSNVAGLPGVEVRYNSNLQETLKNFDHNNLYLRSKSREALDCPHGTKSCTDGSKCVSVEHFCDNEVHCNDASDEMLCVCKDRVGMLRLCDGYLDCPNGEDEQKCFSCKENEFSCDDWSRLRAGTCISLSQRCDGVRDCDITGKDEEDCSILTNHIGQHGLYPISNSVGFLHHNYKGKWYPTCIGTEIWALEVCQIESGPSATFPQSQLVETSDSYDGLYINLLSDNKISLEETCLKDKAVFIECPPLFCGLRITMRNPFRNFEVDTSVEDILNELSNKPELKSNETVGGVRVVGGKPSQPAAWPWLVSIYKNGMFHCGGVLINELWIVTAAHCVDKYWQFYYEIQIGMLRRFSFSPMEQSRWSAIAIPHEDYERNSLKNDIALIKLSSAVKFNRYVRPICLPSETTAGSDYLHGPAEGTICTTVGWGATIEHGADPDHMREVEVPVLKSCKHIEDNEVDDICAGLLTGGKDACQGDSGGPLMCRNNNNPNQWYLAGIVSHGEGCARPNEPGVYTKVSRYLGWIAEHTRNVNVISRRRPLQKCPGYTCLGTNRCLPKKRRCDKIVDCLLGDDEFHCRASRFIFRHPEVVGSPPPMLNITKPRQIEIKEQNIKQETYFVCKKLLQIISIEKKCNKIVDCEDGSDETSCSCADYIMNSNRKAICDGITDCKDVSDEAECFLAKCSPDEYLCRINNECIPLMNRCDGFSHCSNMEDEWDCVALTDDGTLTLDSDLRPRQSRSGIITINRFGVWRPLCTNTTDNIASIATNVCNLLGFEEYTAFYKFPIQNKPFNVTINGFEKNHSSNENSLLLSSSLSSKETVTLCDSLFIRCSNVSLDNRIHQVNNITKEIEFYITPWNAAIYLDGKYRCMGTLLDTQWIVTSAECIRGEVFLKTHYVAVLFGKGNRFLDIEGPYEQIKPVVQIVSQMDNKAVYLKLQTTITIDRYVRPASINPRREGIQEKCIAIGLNSNKIQIINLKSLENCRTGYRCFQTINKHECKPIDNWSGVINCDSRNGWYPAATFSNLNTTCFDNVELKAIFPNIFFNKIIQNESLYLDEEKSMVQCENKGFRCLLGECISWNQTCDSVPDCRNGEDEENKLCGAKAGCHLTGTCDCNINELKCKNGKCIEKNLFCDKINQCGDNSDEPPICSCKSYLELTRPEKICDGILNCYDRSDEDPNYCYCNLNYFRCGKRNNDLCIPNEMVCDGHTDCPNGEDETVCLSLKANYERTNAGEVMTRTAGVWHSGCFTQNYTVTELENYCRKLGFSGSSARHLIQPSMSNVGFAERPVIDTFQTVWFHRSKKSKLRLRIRTGNEPYVTFKEDRECYKLFIECM